MPLSLVQLFGQYGEGYAPVLCSQHGNHQRSLWNVLRVHMREAWFSSWSRVRGWFSIIVLSEDDNSQDFYRAGSASWMFLSNMLVSPDWLQLFNLGAGSFSLRINDDGLIIKTITGKGWPSKINSDLFVMAYATYVGLADASLQDKPAGRPLYLLFW